MPREQVIHQSEEEIHDRPGVSRRQRVIGFTVTAAFAISAALAPVAQAGVSAQHNQTLVVV